MRNRSEGEPIAKKTEHRESAPLCPPLTITAPLVDARKNKPPVNSTVITPSSSPALRTKAGRNEGKREGRREKEEGKEGKRPKEGNKIEDIGRKRGKGEEGERKIGIITTSEE